MGTEKRTLGGAPLRVCKYCNKSSGIILQFTEKVDGEWHNWKAHQDCQQANGDLK